MGLDKEAKSSRLSPLLDFFARHFSGWNKKFDYVIYSKMILLEILEFMDWTH